MEPDRGHLRRDNAQFPLVVMTPDEDGLAARRGRVNLIQLTNWSWPIQHPRRPTHSINDQYKGTLNLKKSLLDRNRLKIMCTNAIW